jgi:hypothetical protein
MGVKIKVTRAGRKAETPEETDSDAILRTPIANSLDADSKTMLSMTKQLEEALMKERTPVYSGFFDGSLPEPRFGTDQGHRGFTTTSKQNRKTAVEFRKNGKP